MDNIEIDLKIVFSLDEDQIHIETKDVPPTMILEALSNFTKFYARQILEDAEDFHEGKMNREKYLNARIKVDRAILNKMLED